MVRVIINVSPCNNMGKHMSPARVIVDIHNLPSLWHLLRCHKTKLVKIRSFHGYIYIIIPWNEPLVSYSPKQCTPVCKILDIMFPANPVYLSKNLYHACPVLLHHRFHIESFSYLSFKIIVRYIKFHTQLLLLYRCITIILTSTYSP